ncbi:hypothetical protein C8Q76DRAFT_714880 [Earliella scabrosa]|nr:hypothetical protein C8Q76DRAFT_714880 [Earliella scabrosa]
MTRSAGFQCCAQPTLAGPQALNQYIRATCRYARSLNTLRIRTTSAPAQPKVAVLGGGIGALSLLLALYRRGISATLYEPGAAPTVPESTGNSEQRPVGDNEDQDEAQENLRKKLVDACPPESILWDYVFSSARTLDDGKHELTFVNGQTAVCDLFIGTSNSTVPEAPSPHAAAAHFAMFPQLGDVIEALGRGDVFALPELADINGFSGFGAPFTPWYDFGVSSGRGGRGGFPGHAWHRGGAGRRGHPGAGSARGGHVGGAPFGRGGPGLHRRPFGGPFGLNHSGRGHPLHVHPPFPPSSATGQPQPEAFGSAPPDAPPPFPPSADGFPSAGSHPPFPPPPSFGPGPSGSPENIHPAFPPPASFGLLAAGGGGSVSVLFSGPPPVGPFGFGHFPPNDSPAGPPPYFMRPSGREPSSAGGPGPSSQTEAAQGPASSA